MGLPLKTSPKRIGHTYKYYVIAFGESVLLTGLRLHGEEWATPPETMPIATQPVVTQ
jgi:hypothetical protein